VGWLSSGCVQNAHSLEVQARRDLQELRETLIARRAAEAEASTDAPAEETEEAALPEDGEPGARREPTPPPTEARPDGSSPAPEPAIPADMPELERVEEEPATLELGGRVLAVGTGLPVQTDTPLVVLASPAGGDAGTSAFVDGEMESVELELGDGDGSEAGFAITSPGRPVTFVNRGEICHSYFSTSPSNEFDLGLLNPGEARTLVLQHPGSVQVYCSLHAGKQVSLVVAPTPHYAKVAEDGGFTLEGLAPGSYDLEVWGDDLRSRRVRAEVPQPAGEEIRISVGPGLPEGSE